jgi:hypothetical protein
MVEVLKATAELMAAREATARIAGELAAYQAMVAPAGRLSGGYLTARAATWITPDKRSSR